MSTARVGLHFYLHCPLKVSHEMLTLQRFEGVRLEGDDWHKGIVAVVDLVPEAELWPLNVPCC